MAPNPPMCVQGALTRIATPNLTWNGEEVYLLELVQQGTPSNANVKQQSQENSGDSRVAA